MDRDIVQAAREGNPHAKAALGSWLCSELRAFFTDSKQPEHDDLIQEALVDILKKLALAPDDLELLRSFVHSFAGTEVLESTRDHGRELARAALLRQEPHTPAETPSVSVLGPLLDKQRRQLVIEHAQRLRPIFRDAILHLLEGATTSRSRLATRSGSRRRRLGSRVRSRG